VGGTGHPRSLVHPWSGTPAKLRPVAVNVRDRVFVAPGNLVAVQSEYDRDAIALARARCPAAAYDCLNALPIETSLGGELLIVQAVRGAQFLDTFRTVHIASTSVAACLVSSIPSVPRERNGR